MVKLGVHDVRGDGHCFFRAVACALLTTPERVEDLTHGLRMTLGLLAKTTYRSRTEYMIKQALDTCILPGIDCFLSSTVFDFVNRTNPGVDEYADMLIKTNAFASFVEVELMRMFLKRRDIALIVVPSMASLEDPVDWAKRIKKLQKRKEKRVMILLNADGVHYMWVSFDGESLPTMVVVTRWGSPELKELTTP